MKSSPDSPPRRGRRAGSPETRAAILQAARELFAAHGYDKTTLRAVAERAGVDGALPSYYFGGKPGLFAAALELPIRPSEAIGSVLAQSDRRDDLAERLLRMLLTVWDGAAGGPLAALLRSATSQEDLLNGFVEDEVLPLLRQAIDGPDAELRAAGAATQVIGLVLTRYVLRVEPLASSSADDVVALVAPSLQRYFTA
jgi:AcrR family transcriptional regulator